ncbi:hypothetical protein F1B92_06890 [Campylobacter sp. FMV-PI01]|uniref:Uncharacterized protein n=2 Tax=Campylobacter portucalensis TaxID=2608384 RepID=A0A6L5WML1_9BACT|nr:hypothetical protein [Campylobacter portucalensis]
MGFLLALLNRNKAKIEIIYAEQISEMGKPRVFEFKFLTEYVNIIDFFFVLKSFNEFVKIPYSDTEDLLYLKLKDFSESLLSNQILKCTTKYPDLKNELISRQNSDLYFLKNEISEVLNDIEFFENISKKERYEVYYKISKFLYNKNYFLNTSNFLIEALHMYFFKYLKKYIISKNSLEPNYEVLQLCLNFINQGTLNDKNYEIKPPCDYFIELNSAVFMQLADFRRKIGEIRHELSHISTKNISLKSELKILLGDFENLVLKEDILSNLVEIVDEERVKDFTSYHLEKFATQVRNKTLTKNIKTDTVKNKLLDFYNGKLSKTDECYDLFKTNNKSKILALNLKNKELYFNPNLKE